MQYSKNLRDFCYEVMKHTGCRKTIIVSGSEEVKFTVVDNSNKPHLLLPYAIYASKGLIDQLKECLDIPPHIKLRRFKKVGVVYIEDAFKTTLRQPSYISGGVKPSVTYDPLNENIIYR